MTSRRAGIAVGVLVFGLLLVLVVFRRTSTGTGSTPEPVRKTPEAANAPTEPMPGASAESLPGDRVLQDYATARTTPEQDLELVARAMDNFLLLVKSGRRGPLADNEDWAAAWQGRRASREVFVSAGHRILKDGRLVDRWETPLFFHALGGGRIEVRSAGPDRRLWTEDDIHRNPDGTFRRGAALNPSSLAGH